MDGEAVSAGAVWAVRWWCHRAWQDRAGGQEVRAAIAARVTKWGMAFHSEKTKVVSCKDDDRRRTYPNEKFDFLGDTIRARRSKNRTWKFSVNFSPAVSDKAVHAIRAELRSGDLHQRSDK
jgi:RNA-directed DNA polymerase